MVHPLNDKYRSLEWLLANVFDYIVVFLENGNFTKLIEIELKNPAQEFKSTILSVSVKNICSINLHEMISLFTKLSTTRKALLLAGILILLISTCVIFPIQYSKAIVIEEFGYTYLTLASALLLIMSGLMGKHFFKGILFLILSSIIGVVFFFVAYPPFSFAAFIAIWLGIPSGIITALLFMIVNFYFFNKVKSHKLLKQIIVYLVLLLIVSVLFGYGGDWMFEISQYFKNGKQ